MTNITLHREIDRTITSVPNIFIDEYMADADGEFVKIYLYLLRCIHSSMDSFSIGEMADRFEHTEKDIKRALRYWESINVMRLEYNDQNELLGICLLDLHTKKESSLEQPAEKAVSKSDSTSRENSDSYAPVSNETVSTAESELEKPEFSLDEMKAFRQDKGVQELLFITETYIGHTLSTTDIHSILYWHDTLTFSIDLIEYLIEYCVGKGRKSIRYMEKVALAWHESGFTTVDEAKKASAFYNQVNTSIIKAFGISGRTLVESELTYIDKWSKTYGFTLDLILEACKKTMQAIHQPSFEYTDSILSNWRKKDISSLDDIATLDAAYLNQKSKTPVNPAPKAVAATNKFNNFPQRSYNYDQLEKQLLNNSMQ